MPAKTAPSSEDPTWTVPAALLVGDAELAADVAAAEAALADLEAIALALLEFIDEGAVTMPLGAEFVVGATMIPPAAVAAVGAAVVEEISEAWISVTSLEI
jgi:hypothetical protein